MGSLSNLYISQSYQSLAHLGTNQALVPGTMTQLQDGIGQSFNISFDGTNISSSGNIYAANITGSSINTGSFATTASFNQYTASTNSRLNNLESNSASVNISISNLNLATSSLNSSVVQLNANTASQQLQINSLINATSSYITTPLTSLNSYTQSNDAKWTNLNNVSGAWVTESETGSFLVTASVNLNTITFTKANASTFNITVNTGSGGATTDLTSLNAFTQSIIGTNPWTASIDQKFATIGLQSGSWSGGGTDLTSLNLFTQSQDTKNSTLASYTGSNDTKWNTLGGQSGSWITESETGSFARYDVSNPWSANQTFTNITAVSASFQFVQTTYETSSVIYSSGSNIFGDSILDTQTLNGQTIVSGSLGITGSFRNNTLLYPTTDNGAKSFMQTDGAGNLSLQYVKTVYETVRNTNPYPIVKGAPLFASGSTGDNANVFYADASDSTIMPAVYIAGETLAPGATGLAIVGGLIEGVDTTGFPAGTIVYVAEGGGWSASRPSGSNSIVQVLGVVQKEGVGGQGVVINQLEAVLPNIQTGYAWVGDGTNQPVAVATASFIDAIPLTSLNAFTASQEAKDITLASVTASLNAYTQSNDTKWTTLGGLTGSYATTGSNVFTGDQTLIDNAGNFFTISDASGSMMLVAKGFTSASAHISASATGNTNLIFKNNNNTADTIISGSTNIFTNPTAPTAGFKRFIGGSGNFINNPASIPSISSSMAFPVTMSFNSIAGTGTVVMRGPVSSSLWTINNNIISSNLNFGTSAANNAEKIQGLVVANTNIISNGVSIIANRSVINAQTTINNNNFGFGTTTLTLASSSISYIGNFGNPNITNGFSNAAAASTSANNVLSVATNIFAGAPVIITSGSDSGGANNPRVIYGNFIQQYAYTNDGGTINLNLNGSGSSLTNTMVFGLGNIVTGSNAVDTNTGTSPQAGSSFFGRWNSNDGIRNKSAENIFSVGTGTSNTNRKTGFLIDSGSNTFVEGSLNVSGSASFTGSVYGNVVSMSVNSNTASMDLSLGNYFELTSSASPLRIELSNVRAGLTSTLIVSASVSTSIAFSPNVGQPSPGAYSGSAAASTDILSFVAFNSSKINLVATKNII